MNICVSTKLISDYSCLVRGFTRSTSSSSDNMISATNRVIRENRAEESSDLDLELGQGEVQSDILAAEKALAKFARKLPKSKSKRAIQNQTI